MHGTSKIRPVSVFLAIALSLVIMLSGCSNGGDSGGGGGPSISLVSITVTPSIPDIPSGISIQFTATGYYSDGSSRDITAMAIWTSSDTTVATVTATRGLVAGVSPGVTTIRALSGAVSGTANLIVTSATLGSIAVTPSAPTIASGTTQQFTATGTFSDLSTMDLTTQVTWSSSNTAAATISTAVGSKGRATGVAAGTTNITATLNTITSPVQTLTVTSATLLSIAVTPSAPTIANGTTQQFTAIGTFTSGPTQDLTTQVTWYSSNFLVALISNTTGSKGLATARSTGTSNITARFGTTITSPAVMLTVTNATLVSIAVTPSTPGAVAAGTTLQFSATGTYSDLTTQILTSQVTWSSSDTTKATISNTAGSKGLASALDTGTTDITATLGAVTSSPAVAFTVNAPTLEFITISPLTPIVAMGTTQQFTCNATYSNNSTQNVTTSATWNSAVTGVATIGLNTGLATPVAVGVTTITADYSGQSHSTGITITPAALVSISVAPSSPSVLVGATRQFTATGNYSDGSSSDITTSVTWTSSNQTVATVNATGLATAVKAGFTQIRATFGTITGFTTMTVPVSLTSITVTPSTKSIALGTKWQFTATGNYSDGSSLDITTSATWTSLATLIATVSDAAGSKGLASAVGVGSSTITADYGGEQGTAVLTVTNAVLTSIVVTPADQSIPIGSTRQFTATGSFNDATSQDITRSVTWASTNSGIASISNTSGSQGLATAVSVGGPVTISATGIPPLAGVVGNTSLTVTLPSNAYVTNFDSNSVTVINTVTDTVSATITVGDRPSGIAVDLAANRAYVANSGDGIVPGTVSVINTISNTVVNTITVGIGPEGVSVHPTAGKVYVANNGGNSVSVINTATGLVTATVTVGTNPYRIAIDAAANRAYVTNEGSYNISVINTATDTLVATFGSGGFTPRGIAVNPALSRIYVVNSSNNYVAVMSVAGTPVAYPAVGTGPISMTIDLSSSPAKVYVGNTGAGTVSVIRTDSNAIDGTITVGTYPYGIGIQTASGKAYVANFLDDSVSVINTTSKAIITTITVPPADLVNLKGPYGVAVP